MYSFQAVYFMNNNVTENVKKYLSLGIATMPHRLLLLITVSAPLYGGKTSGRKPMGWWVTMYQKVG
ncbi:MAG: hypothetical protein AXW15_07005 [Neptuniibacter sp. Phe_28]|nr:MAG: hypothetical protein AXW15_07005 [Neptuniibacter sp. Phe_28]